MTDIGSVNPLILVPVLFTVGGLAFVVMGIRSLRSARSFQAVALRAPGIVTDLRYRTTRTTGTENGPSGSWFPVLRFATADGRHVDTEAMYGQSPRPARVGDTVAVLYDPEDPTRAALEGKLGGGFLGVMFVVMGSMFALLGLGIGGAALLVRNSL